jgi:hypothetical protein
MELALIVLGILIFAYFFFFIKTKQYLIHDSFQNMKLLKKGDSIPVEQSCGDEWTKPYATMPIMKVDDYDHDVVYQQEGDRQYSKAMINRMTSQRPFEWPGLPPSAGQFQVKQQQWMVDIATASGSPQLADSTEGGPKFHTYQDYMDAEQRKTEASGATQKYRTIEGFATLPPDYDGIEAEERKLLQTYVPACSKDLKYDVDDAKDLIKKIYAKKGLKAKVDVRDDGVYEVYETMEKNPKIVYEDDPRQVERLSEADSQSATIEVPQAADDLASGLDPFFSTNGRLRADRTDYTQWTPGLERMFAPNESRTNWY